VTSFYPADLARIHDEGFGEFARAASCEVLRRLPQEGLVVELGCGSGISTQILSEAGYQVVGIDIAADMLAIARRRAPSAELRRASIWEAELPPCVGVTAIGEVINYAADERAGAEQLPELFARVHDALLPDGVFIFDFATPGRGTLRAGGPHVREGTDWRIESEAVEDPASKTLERRMTLDVGGRQRAEVHRLRLYEPELVKGCLEHAGFRSEALAGYCDFGFWPGYGAFAALKPACSSGR
jgi:SAM-dependent methyltransferase